MHSSRQCRPCAGRERHSRHSVTAPCHWCSRRRSSTGRCTASHLVRWQQACSQQAEINVLLLLFLLLLLLLRSWPPRHVPTLQLIHPLHTASSATGCMSDLHVSPHRAWQLCISHQGSGIGMNVCVPAAVSHQPMPHLASKILPASLLQLWQVQCLGAYSSSAMQSRATANLSAMTAIWAALRGGDIRLAATTSMGGAQSAPQVRERGW